MEAVDEYIPTPERDTEKPFLMPVESAFSIAGRGTVASGRVELGQIAVGDEIEIVGIRGPVSDDLVSVKINSLYLVAQTYLHTIFIPRKRVKPQNIVAMDEKKWLPEKSPKPLSQISLLH